MIVSVSVLIVVLMMMMIMIIIIIIIPSLETIPEIFLEGLSKITKTFIRGN